MRPAYVKSENCRRVAIFDNFIIIQQKSFPPNVLIFILLNWTIIIQDPLDYKTEFYHVSGHGIQSFNKDSHESAFVALLFILNP